MMRKIDNNMFSKKLNEFFKENIKSSYVSKISVILVTKDDKCYEFKRDYFIKGIKNSLIALSDNKSKIMSLIEDSFVEELSHNQVIDFKGSYYHTIARTFDGNIYSWGQNNVLGYGSYNEMKSKPKWIKFLNRENIIEMYCGLKHTLNLTLTGDVYAWGCNKWGQIGNGICGENEYQSTPFKLDSFNGEKVKDISCGETHSMALTESGRVYSWGCNFFGQLGIGNRQNYNTPQLIKLSEQLIIDKISCGYGHSLLLSSDGDIFVCGRNMNGELGTADRKNTLSPIKLSYSEKFVDIASHYFYSISAAISVNSVYYIWGACGDKIINHPKETEFKSFDDIFEHYFQISYKTIKGKIILFNDYFTTHGKYLADFTENRKLGEGGFGEVFKVTRNYRKAHFAIKKIKFTANYGEEFIKELETSPIISGLNHQNIVKYYDMWLENDFIIRNEVKSYLKNFIIYIQMELCDKSLNGLNDELVNDSNFFSNGTLTPLGYYIASEIFIEILKGVNYLHLQNPPIIHRDLKPENIMLKIEKQSDRFVKIADMGLATLHKLILPLKPIYGSFEQLHTIDRGTLEYMAPEVENVVFDDNTKAQYGTKADIYSLGVIFKQLLHIDIDRDYIIDENQVLLVNHKYEAAKYLSIAMNRDDPNDRPDCNDLLDDKHLWAFASQEFDDQKVFENFLHSNERNESFLFELVKRKIFPETSSEMNYEKFRIESFKECPIPWIDVRLLAANGFYYEGDADTVKCNFCNIQIGEWEAGDVPDKDHERLAPNCPFVRGEETKNIPFLNSKNIKL